jgi:hypothetical protein
LRVPCSIFSSQFLLRSEPSYSVCSQFLQAAGVSVLFSSVIFLDLVSFSVDLFSLPPIGFYSSLISSLPPIWRDFSADRCPTVVCAALIGPSARSYSRSAQLLFCAVFIPSLWTEDLFLFLTLPEIASSKFSQPRAQLPAPVILTSVCDQISTPPVFRLFCRQCQL